MNTPPTDDSGATTPHRVPGMERTAPEATQPARRMPPAAPIERRSEAPRPASGGRRRRSAVLAGLALGLALGLYLLGPWRTTVLVLGLDRAPQGTAVARSDTMLLVTVDPPSGYAGMLSLPRDLWVSVPGLGPGRINTAHFFGEAAAPGQGPPMAVRTVSENFGLDIDGYVRVTFDGIVDSVDALGGLVIDLPTAMSGYAAGEHRLDGRQALAFVRDRAGSDDFFRMQRSQLFLKAALRQAARPASWPRMPLAAAAFLRSLESNLPVWEWPRLIVGLLRAGADGIDGRTITREMVQPFTTDQGAQVLAPVWERINPVLLEMFGQ